MEKFVTVLTLKKKNYLKIAYFIQYVCHGEHSVVDALIYCHIIEYYKYHEAFVPEFRLWTVFNGYKNWNVFTVTTRTDTPPAPSSVCHR